MAWKIPPIVGQKHAVRERVLYGAFRAALGVSDSPLSHHVIWLAIGAGLYFGGYVVEGYMNEVKYRILALLLLSGLAQPTKRLGKRGVYWGSHAVTAVLYKKTAERRGRLWGIQWLLERCAPGWTVWSAGAVLRPLATRSRAAGAQSVSVAGALYCGVRTT
jgi:hypothetical protein